MTSRLGLYMGYEYEPKTKLKVCKTNTTNHQRSIYYSRSSKTLKNPTILT